MIIHTDICGRSIRRRTAGLEKNFDIGAAEFAVKPGLDLRQLFGQKLLA